MLAVLSKWRRLAVAAASGAVVLGGVSAVGAGTAHAAGSIDVFVGYADSLRANPVNFPTPFAGSPGVTYKGCDPSSCTFDGGAIRVVNNTPATISIDSIKAQLSTCVYDIWPGSVSIAPGNQLIVAQRITGPDNGCTTNGHFDTSDVGPNGAPWSGNCTQSGVIPQVLLTIDGQSSTLSDSGQVLNTGGVDKALCPQGTNESTQWTPIGHPPCPGAHLSLAPATQTHRVGEIATITATLTNSCGDPLAGANIGFKAISGPNAGRTGSGTTNANGQASFSYTSAKSGTDTWVAGTTNPAGTILSNTVKVIWQAITDMTGRAYGVSATVQAGLVTVTLPATPDTGSVDTTKAETVQPACVATVNRIVIAHTLCAKVVTTVNPFSSTADATVQDATTEITGVPTVAVTAVHATSKTTCSGSTGSTTIDSLKIGGTTVISVPTHPAPNTTYNLVGVKVILNEQTPIPGGLHVNGVHIIALNGVADVILSSAESDIHNC